MAPGAEFGLESRALRLPAPSGEKVGSRSPLRLIHLTVILASFSWIVIHLHPMWKGCPTLPTAIPFSYLRDTPKMSKDIFPNILAQKSLKRKDEPRVLLQAGCGEPDVPSPCSLPSTKVSMALYTGLGWAVESGKQIVCSFLFPP